VRCGNVNPCNSFVVGVDLALGLGIVTEEAIIAGEDPVLGQDLGQGTENDGKGMLGAPEIEQNL
jgi:hypothetical protein